MNDTTDRSSAPEEAARELDALLRQGKEARALLERLRREVAQAESLLESSQGARLLEANEQLVLAILHAQGESDSAAQALDRLAQSSQHDPLTGLPNRILLLDRLTRAIAHARRRGAHVALLLLDLNHFKQINDTLGHAAGDDALRIAARCLASSVREVDTVSRHGGDEFLILLAEVTRASDATRIAEKLIGSLAVPRQVGEHVIRLTASIGISLYPDDGADAETLIAHADVAMLRAKRQRMGSFVFYDELSGAQPEPGSAGLASMQRPVGRRAAQHVAQERRNAQLREANEQLILAALGAQEVKAAADAARERQTSFLAVLAHELRTPLSPILNAAALLGQARAEGAPLPWIRAVIERQVSHMTRLVSDLLDVSRISTGKLRLERRHLDLKDVLDQAVDTYRPAMDARLQRFDVHLPRGALEMDGDPVRLAQVLGNLLNNASKYTPDGGEIDLTVSVVEGAVVIDVTDTGIGITAEALPNVFDAFVQDVHAIGFNGAGLGIGLTVVRELVEAHGGTIVASSLGAGLGSQFLVTLPLKAGRSSNP